MPDAGEVRRPVLEAAFRALGARLVETNGCLLPERFSAVAEECRAVRTAAGVLDRTDRAYLTAAGPDTRRYLHAMVTNEVKALEAGQGRYALQLNAQGQILADLYVLAMDDHVLLETDWALKEKLRAVLEKYIIADDVELADRSDQLAALAVEGPRAGELLRAAGATVLPGAELNHAWVKVGESPVLVVRLGETGEEGYRLIFDVEYAQNLWDALTAAQASVAWKPVGHAAFELLRTEAGLARYGAELDERTLPPEAGLEARAISYTKGCYLGQEIVERIRSRGHVNRKLVGLALDAGGLPSHGAKLAKDGKEAGFITTAIDSPTLGRRIALGYLRREHLAPGTVLEVEGGGAAEVVPLPFYSPQR
ncbi:MAG: aminomethyltransferase family protein [Candidatus Acidiferrales bacterium]